MDPWNYECPNSFCPRDEPKVENKSLIFFISIPPDLGVEILASDSFEMYCLIGTTLCASAPQTIPGYHVSPEWGPRSGQSENLLS